MTEHIVSAVLVIVGMATLIVLIEELRRRAVDEVEDASEWGESLRHCAQCNGTRFHRATIQMVGPRMVTVWCCESHG